MEPIGPSQQFAASRFEFLTVDSHREEMLMLIPLIDAVPCSSSLLLSFPRFAGSRPFHLVPRPGLNFLSGLCIVPPTGLINYITTPSLVFRVRDWCKTMATTYGFIRAVPRHNRRETKTKL